MSYTRQLSRESYPSAEMQSVYSTAPTEWASKTNGQPIFLKKKQHWLSQLVVEAIQAAAVTATSMLSCIHML